MWTCWKCSSSRRRAMHPSSSATRWLAASSSSTLASCAFRWTNGGSFRLQCAPCFVPLWFRLFDTPNELCYHKRLLLGVLNGVSFFFGDALLQIVDAPFHFRNEYLSHLLQGRLWSVAPCPTHRSNLHDCIPSWKHALPIESQWPNGLVSVVLPATSSVRDWEAFV